jgi:plastocyanin
VRETNQRSKKMNNDATTTNSTVPPPNNGNKGLANWRNPSWGLLGAVLLLAIAAIVISLMHSANKKNSGSLTPRVSGQVEITDAQFSPQVISIKAGQSVTWTNHGSVAHWVASDPYPKDDTLKSLNSNGALLKNDSYTYTFDKTGKYTYHDNLNPLKLQGTVVVK